MSFIETSALDASNVESAFQTILTGACCVAFCYFLLNNEPSDIYRIVSAKTLESGPTVIAPTEGITVSEAPTNQAGGKCC